MPETFSLVGIPETFSLVGIPETLTLRGLPETLSLVGMPEFSVVGIHATIWQEIVMQNTLFTVFRIGYRYRF
jgi:hypothetical protein